MDDVWAALSLVRWAAPRTTHEVALHLRLSSCRCALTCNMRLSEALSKTLFLFSAVMHVPDRPSLQAKFAGPNRVGRETCQRQQAPSPFYPSSEVHQ